MSPISKFAKSGKPLHPGGGGGSYHDESLITARNYSNETCVAYQPDSSCGPQSTGYIFVVPKYSPIGKNLSNLNLFSFQIEHGSGSVRDSRAFNCFCNSQ